jgi:hypothetical protein
MKAVDLSCLEAFFEGAVLSLCARDGELNRLVMGVTCSR